MSQVSYNEYLSYFGIDPREISPEQNAQLRASFEAELAAYESGGGDAFAGAEKPGAAQQIAGAGGQVAGLAAGGAGASYLTDALGIGGGVGEVGAAGAPAAPEVISGTVLGSSPSTPSVIGGSTIPAASEGVGAFGGGTGLLSAGYALPAAAVAAAYGPSLIKHGGEVLSGESDSDSQVKTALMTNPITAWAPPLMDALGISIKSGKGEDQLRRDAAREALDSLYSDRESGHIALADGGIYDTGEHPTDQSYNIDWKALSERPDGNEIVGRLNPLVAAIIGNDDKLQSDLVGEFYNAATSGGDAMQNIDTFYQNSGKSWGDLKHEAKLAWDRGEIDADERDARFAALDKQFGVENTSGARWEDVAGLSEEERRRNELELKRAAGRG